MFDSNRMQVIEDVKEYLKNTDNNKWNTSKKLIREGRSCDLCPPFKLNLKDLS